MELGRENTCVHLIIILTVGNFKKDTNYHDRKGLSWEGVEGFTQGFLEKGPSKPTF